MITDGRIMPNFHENNVPKNFLNANCLMQNVIACYFVCLLMFSFGDTITFLLTGHQVMVLPARKYPSTVLLLVFHMDCWVSKGYKYAIYKMLSHKCDK